MKLERFPRSNRLEIRPDHIRVVGLAFEEYLILASRVGWSACTTLVRLFCAVLPYFSNKSNAAAVIARTPVRMVGS